MPSLHIFVGGRERRESKRPLPRIALRWGKGAGAGLGARGGYCTCFLSLDLPMFRFSLSVFLSITLSLNVSFYQAPFDLCLLPPPPPPCSLPFSTPPLHPFSTNIQIPTFSLARFLCRLFFLAFPLCCFAPPCVLHASVFCRCRPCRIEPY